MCQFRKCHKPLDGRGLTCHTVRVVKGEHPVNTFTQLSQTIDTLQSEGKTVKVTRLTSQATRSHKTLWTPKARGKGSVKVS